jgi:hypothetical protein
VQARPLRLGVLARVPRSPTAPGARVAFRCPEVMSRAGPAAIRGRRSRRWRRR